MKGPTEHLQLCCIPSAARCDCSMRVRPPPLDVQALQPLDAPTTQSPVEPKRRYSKALSRFLLRIDVSFTIVYFVLLSIIGLTIASITRTQVMKANVQTFHALHEARLATTLKLFDQESGRVYNMALAYMSLYSQKPFAMQSEDTLAQLCSILVAYDVDRRILGFTASSLTLVESISCFDAYGPSRATLTLSGFISYNHFIYGTYYIDPSTYRFMQPLRPIIVNPPNAFNTSGVITKKQLQQPIIEVGEQYYNGTRSSVDDRLMWMQQPNVPHIIYFTLPASIIARGMSPQADFDLNDYINVKLDGSRLASAASLLPFTGFSLAVFDPFTLPDRDPNIISDNWGQPSVSDDTLATAFGAEPLQYLHVSEVSDPFMRAALRHVDFRALQTEGYRLSVGFSYRGAPAVVTAWAYRTSKGLVLPLVMASPQEPLTGSYRRTMDIWSCVLTAVIGLLTSLFWRFVCIFFTRPLQGVATTMHCNLRVGAATPAATAQQRQRAHKPPCVQLSEVAELLDAYDTAARRLRDVDTFIPDAARRKSRQAHSTLGREAPKPGLPDAPPATLVQHTSTAVYVSVAHRHASSAPLFDASAMLQQHQALAAVASAVAHATPSADSGPFPTPAALEGFATAVLELCRAHHGTLYQLCPDACLLHFHGAVRTRLAGSECGGVAAVGASAACDATQDARDAAAFALALLQWVDRHRGGATQMPDVCVLLDTALFACGQYCPLGSEQTLQVALGRDAQRSVGHLPQRIGVRVAATEATATLLRAEGGAGVRLIPVEALCTGREGLDSEVTTLYEVLPGRAEHDAAWQLYARCCAEGFACMLRGDYAAAVRAYRGVADIADLEPGLLPASLRREAAASTVAGGAVSVQVARLLHECEMRVAAGVVDAYCRTRADPLGVDNVLGQGGRPLHFLATVNEPIDGVKAVRVAMGEAQPPGARVWAALPLYPPARGRHVMVVQRRNETLRFVVPAAPDWVRDHLGLYWSIGRAPERFTPETMWNDRLLALGSAGALASVNYLAFNEVPPSVAKAIRDAPPGPMSEELSSATPVCGPTPQQRAAVRRIAFTNRSLSHPNLLRMLAFSESLEGGVAFIWEYAPGGTLRQMLSRYLEVKPLTLISFVVQVLNCVCYLHRRGLPHGNLRLDNVMVGTEGTCRLRGQSANRALSRQTFRLPLTCYLSPLMATGALPTAPCDMFCLGLMALEALTRQSPWKWASTREGQPMGTPEQLESLMDSGGWQFCDALLQQRVVVNLDPLRSPTLEQLYGSPIVGAVRAMLSLNPAERPTAGQCRALFAVKLKSLQCAAERDAVPVSLLPFSPSMKGSSETIE